jgi:hypothetical protein
MHALAEVNRFHASIIMGVMLIFDPGACAKEETSQKISFGALPLRLQTKEI